jgi:hypothetical protein
MIPIITSRLTTSCSRLARRQGTRPLLHLPLAVCVLACVSCTEQGPPMVDTTPLGEGLKVIGYAIIGAAVLAVLGKLVK